jgi:hypothetical protein
VYEGHYENDKKHGKGEIMMDNEIDRMYLIWLRSGCSVMMMLTFISYFNVGKYSFYREDEPGDVYEGEYFEDMKHGKVRKIASLC